jgi:hypothetical protein
VFDRFESRSHGSQHRGPGLGLSIVKSLVELHGGEMTLASEVGRGTRVTVRLPERGKARTPEMPPERAATASTPGAAQSTGQSTAQSTDQRAIQSSTKRHDAPLDRSTG